MLHVITGPMGSGKSNALISEWRYALETGRAVWAFVHSLAVDEAGQRILSRTGENMPAMVIDSLYEVWNRAQSMPKPSVFLIDELQFFPMEEIPIIAELARDHDVVVAGLDTDFRGEPFEIVAYSLGLADVVQKLVAECAKCGSVRATRTQRIINGQPAPYLSERIMPGQDGLYEARCVRCHEVPGRPVPEVMPREAR